MAQEQSSLEEHKEEPGGAIQVEHEEGEIKPPVTEESEAAAAAAAAEEREEITGRKVGKIPISSAVIKPPLRLEGNLLAEFTGWAGWIYTDEELEEVAMLIGQCGWELEATQQVIISLIALHGVRFAGFQAWRRKGKPGDLRTKKDTGVEEPGAKPGEETRK